VEKVVLVLDGLLANDEDVGQKVDVGHDLLKIKKYGFGASRVTRLGHFCQLGYFWRLIMIF
jgi:hypothetical protein